MARSFHPTPLVSVVKTVLCAVVLTVLLLAVQGMLAGFLAQLLAAVWLISALLVLFACISTRFQTITLDENTLTYTGGVIATKQVVLPYARITETSYVQGLLDRLLGVGTLSVDNASGSGIAIRIGNVRYADIKPLLDQLKNKAGSSSGT